METATKFNLELSEYLRGARLARRQSKRKLTSWWIYVLPVIGVILFAFVMFNYFRHGTHMTQGESVGFICAIGFCMLPLIPAWERQVYSRRFRRGGWDKVTEVAFDDTGIRIINPGRIETRFFWVAICRVLEKEEVVLLYYSESCCLILPRRIFSETDWTQMREFIANREAAH